MINLDTLCETLAATTECNACQGISRPLIYPTPGHPEGFVIAGWQCSACENWQAHRSDEPLPIYYLEAKPLEFDDDGCFQTADDGSKVRLDVGTVDRVLLWRQRGLSEKEIHDWLRMT